MKATPQNTLVATIASYHKGQWPDTAKLMRDSALHFGYNVLFFGRECTRFETQSELKIEKFEQWLLASNLDGIEHVLWVDSRDCLFVRPLEAVCAEYNRAGSPVLFSCERRPYPHTNREWINRFPVNPRTGRCHFPNSGVWMAELAALKKAFNVLAEVKQLVALDKIQSSAPFITYSDQHLWQCAYLDKLIPMDVDWDERVFCHASTPFDEYDFKTARDDAPVKLANGSEPAVLHFSGGRSTAMPFFWHLFKQNNLMEI